MPIYWRKKGGTSMKYRKFLAILLALVMVIGLMPSMALADGGQDDQPGTSAGDTQPSDGVGAGDPGEPGAPLTEGDPNIPNTEGSEESEESEGFEESEGSKEEFEEGDFGGWADGQTHTHGVDDGTGDTEWTAWNPNTTTLTNSSYYLDDSYNYDNLGTITISGTVNLCLNGNTMTSSSNLEAFIELKEGASLTICDCSNEETGKIDYATTSSLSSYAAIKISEKNCNITLYSGTIYSENGQGIYMMPKGSPASFTMVGGTIDAGHNGINCPGISPVTVNIQGGTIRYSGNQYGITFSSNGTVSVSGGTIAPREDAGTGSAGICRTGGNLYVTNGTIAGKEYGIKLANYNSGDIQVSGGTISASDGYGIGAVGGSPSIHPNNPDSSSFGEELYKLYLTGSPSISGSKGDLYIGVTDTVYASNGSASYNGDNLEVYFNKSNNIDTESGLVIAGVNKNNKEKFVLIYPTGKALVESGEPGNLYIGEVPTTPVEEHAHGVNGETGDDVTWTAWDPSDQTMLTEGSYYLDQNQSYDGLETITISGDVHLCLNGNTMESAADVEQFIVLNSGASLTICDCGDNGEISHTGSDNLAGYAIKINGSSSLTLYSGTVSSAHESGIWISKGTVNTSFTMEGGAVQAEDAAIHFSSAGGAVTINDGTLTYCGKTGIVLADAGAFTMTGGTIQPGTGADPTGTAISRNNTCSIDISGGTITGVKRGMNLNPNSEDAAAGTVHISDGSISAQRTDGEGIRQSGKTMLYLTGTPTISGQKADLYIEQPNAVAATKDTAVYGGDGLSVYFGGEDDEDEAIILDVTDDNKGNFTLTYPKDKVLEERGGDLYLADQTSTMDDLTVTIPETVTYGETAKATVTGAPEGATVAYEIINASPSGIATIDENGNITTTGVGTFQVKVTVTADGYETKVVTKSVTINAKDISDAAVTLGAYPTYDGTQKTQAITSVTVDGTELTDGDYTVTGNTGTDVKAYTLTITGTGNYSGTKEVTWYIQKAVPGVTAPTIRTLTYTGTAQALLNPGNTEQGTMVYSLQETEGYSVDIPKKTDAGTYDVWYKVLGYDGYQNTNPVKLQVIIKKAPLTVTANDTWVYAGNTPKFTATITGYVNGEDGSVLKGKLTFTCDYSEKYSKPGSRHIIYPKGLTADNYDITFKTGTLTVKDPLSPRFNVYVLDSKHGTVEADCRYARKGDVVTLTIKPDWGYELETLTVTDSHGYELKLTYHSNGTYTFTMPRDNVTVKAIFTVRDMPFVDVPGDAWYAGGVRYVYAHGLMNGTGNWRFSPNRTTTRAMIATILYRMEGSPRVYGTSQFGDVEAGSWYEDAVIWATQNDIVEGYTSKTFGPNDPITREQMAAMLYRYADYCRCDMSAGRYVDLSKFSDMNEISDYAIPALRWAVGEEIIEGRTGKRLAPTDTATRAEVAVMLMRFCEDVIW